MYKSSALASRNMVRDANVDWRPISAVSKAAVIRFFSNVRFLMDQRGLSGFKLQKGIFDMLGVRVGADAVSKYLRKANGYDSASMKYLAIYCLYFGEDLIKMLSTDYASEAGK
jgi:hypothetical protein